MKLIFKVSIFLSIFFLSSVHGEISKDKKSILQYAIKAPSTYNLQMWRVKDLSKNEILILLDNKRFLNKIDPENKQSFISIGALIENIYQASIALGYQADVEIIAKDLQDVNIAKITFNKKESKKNLQILKLISKRATHRVAFLKQEIETKIIENLLSLDENNICFFSTISQESKYIQKSLISASVKQANNRGKQKELVGCIRLKKKLAKETRDGITPSMLGYTGFKKWYINHFVDEQKLLSEAFLKKVYPMVANQVYNCSGFFILTSKSDSTLDLINLGRLLQQFWLKATEENLAVHPMSQMLQEEPFKSQINSKLNIDRPIQMILRVGLLNEYQQLSKRRPLEKIMFDNTSSN